MSKNLRIDYISENYENQHLVFKIARNPHQKADLGGYRDLFRNVVFQNAYSQTDQIQQTRPQRFERDTQMFDMNTKSANPIREFGSQTANIQLWIDHRPTKPKISMKYFDSDLWLRRRIEATMFIQKIIRGFLARKRMSNIKRITGAIRDERCQLTETRRLKNETAKMQEIEKRAHPKVL